MFVPIPGVLQGDLIPLFLFIVALVCALRKSRQWDDGLTLKRRQSSHYLAESLPNIGFTDDIFLLEDIISAAQDLLHRVKKATQEISPFPQNQGHA